MKYKEIKIVEDNLITLDKLMDLPSSINPLYLPVGNSNYISKRIAGNFRNKSFYLPEEYDWIIGKDDKGALVLVPLKK